MYLKLILKILPCSGLEVELEKRIGDLVARLTRKDEHGIPRNSNREVTWNKTKANFELQKVFYISNHLKWFNSLNSLDEQLVDFTAE